MNFIKLMIDGKTEFINLDNVTNIFKSKSNGNIYISYVGETENSGYSVFATDLSLDDFVARLAPHNVVDFRTEKEDK